MSESRKIVEVGNVKIVVENKLSNRNPLACPVCKILLRDRNDMLAQSSYGCCRLCEIEVAYPNKSKWMSGWRPTGDELEGIRKKRKQVPSYLLRTSPC
jgi:hypothetical protein